MKFKYYSHSKSIYNTQREHEERSFLQYLYGKTVLCPNEKLSRLQTTEEFQHWIKKCAILVASEFDDYVSYGVLKECQFAFTKHIPVFVIRKSGDTYNLIPVSGVVLLRNGDLMRSGKLQTI
jgi:hypothetical protein